MALHLSIALVVTVSAALFALALPFRAEHLQFVFDLLGQWAPEGALLLVLGCLTAGHLLASRFARHEPVYKAFIVGSTGGGLLALLLRSLQG